MDSEKFHGGNIMFQFYKALLVVGSLRKSRRDLVSALDRLESLAQEIRTATSGITKTNQKVRLEAVEQHAKDLRALMPYVTTIRGILGRL